MSSADFEQMTRALAGSKDDAPGEMPVLGKVTVLGAGLDAQAIACQCLSEGAEVVMFSAYRAELEPLRAAGAISVRGVGPVGNYQINQENVPSIRLTAELDEAVDHADVIFVTGPVLKQRTYSLVLAGHVHDGQVIVIAPGRSLGAVEMVWNLRVSGNTTNVSVVETGVLPWWIRKQGSTLHLGKTGSARGSIIPSGNQQVLAALQRYLPNLVPSANIIESGFSDASGFIETVALTMGGPALPRGGPEVPFGGVPLEEQNSFRNLIGEQHRAAMRALAGERRNVAARWGIRNLPENTEWYDLNAGAGSGDDARPVPDAETAANLVRCAVVGSLVPLVSAARVAGVDVPVTQAMISLSCAVLGGDLLSAGRRLENIGVSADNLEEARRQLEAIAAGRT